MTEWIIIICWILNPYYGFKAAQEKTLLPDGKIWHVYQSSDTATFTQQWNNLTPEERKNSTVIKGQKYIVLPELKLIQEKSFDEILNEEENGCFCEQTENGRDKCFHWEQISKENASCPARSPRRGYFCTRTEGHSGLHHAHCTSICAARWK